MIPTSVRSGQLITESSVIDSVSRLVAGNSQLLPFLLVFLKSGGKLGFPTAICWLFHRFSFNNTSTSQQAKFGAISEVYRDKSKLPPM